MTLFQIGQSRVEEKGLRYKLLLIESLIVILPMLIISYILYVNNVLLSFYHFLIFALILLIILSGLVLLRQIFDRILLISNFIKKAVNNNEYLTDIHKETAELHEITNSFNDLMKGYEDTNAELKRRVFELFAVKEIIEIASKSINIDDLLNMLMEKVMVVTRSQIGSVFVVEHEKGCFRLIAQKGLDGGPKKDSYIDINDSLARFVVSNKKPLLVQDIGTDSRTMKPNDPKYGSPSFISMPIFIRNNLFAILNLSRKEEEQVFDSNDQEILSIMIGEIAFALENAQLHSRVKENLKDLQVRTAELTEANDKLQKEIIRREESESALQKSEELYRDLFENANDLIQSVNLDGCFLQVNKKWHETLGYRKEELSDLTIWDIIHQDFIPKCKEIFQGVFSGETANNIETVFVTKTGKPIQVEGNVNCRIEGGKPLFTRGIFRDITVRKQAEERLINTLKELQETKDMLIQSEKLAAIGQLTAGIAHEILNPVNIISMRFQMLDKSENLSDQVRKILNVCKNQLDRISKITSNVGNFSRISEAQITMSNLQDIIEEVVDICKPQLKVEDIDTNIQCPTNLPLIPLDKDKIKQVLLNIISNAITAMAGRKSRRLHITVITITSKNSIQLKISDTGPGIDEKHLTKVFDPFFTTKDQGEGVGLGLYISYGIVKEHSGKIWVQNNEWGGASFSIELPLGKDAIR